MKVKIKTAMALIFGAIIATTGLVGAESKIVYAQNIQQAEAAANRNEVNITVGDKTAKIIAYNIDGYNYFRIADLCKTLDMKVSFETNPYGQSYIKIISNEPFGSTVENAPTNMKMMVELNSITVFFDSWSIEAKCFNLDGRNYIKLADIVTAANKNNEIKYTSAVEQAKDSVGEAITSRPALYDLKAEFNGDTNTILITKTKIDYQKLYEDLYAQHQGKAPTGSKEVTPSEPTASAQPELTSAPEVGTILAKILKDPSKYAYIDNIVGNGDSTYVNWENYTAPYASGLVGECTWYAMGRFEETTGVAYPHSAGIYNLAEVAKNDQLQVITDPNKIVARSIAVWGSHVAFVEFVEHDAQGTTYVYYSEANLVNANHKSGIYYPEQDGKIKKLMLNEFISKSTTEFKGFIVLK